MSNEAQHLLNHIQYKTGKTLDEIAKEIGYSRPHLNKAKLKGIEGGKIVGILKTKYSKELQDIPQSSQKPRQQTGESLGQVPAEDLIQVLREHNEFLRRNFELSLTGISVQAASILAHVSTSLEKDDEREAAGDAKKLQHLRIDTGKRIGERLGAGVNKNNEIANT